MIRLDSGKTTVRRNRYRNVVDQITKDVISIIHFYCDERAAGDDERERWENIIALNFDEIRLIVQEVITSLPSVKLSELFKVLEDEGMASGFMNTGDEITYEGHNSFIEKTFQGQK